MAKHHDVLLALRALVTAALPDADIIGFEKDGSKAVQAGAGGTVIGHPGDPGEPEIDLNPLTYHYQWSFPLEVAPPRGHADQAGMLATMLAAIGAAVKANRTLGGLVDWLEATAPEEEDMIAAGAASLRWAGFMLTAHFATLDPLGS